MPCTPVLLSLLYEPPSLTQMAPQVEAKIILRPVDSSHIYYIYIRYAKADGSWGIGPGIGLVERFSVRILASLRTDISSTASPSDID